MPRLALRIIKTALGVPDHRPQRVASLQPSATVTLRDLGLLDRLVACTKYCADVCPEVANGSPKIVSDSWSAQSRQILAAHPDLVLASVPYQLEAVAEILKAGVRFLGLAPRTLADVYADIAAIAGVMGAWARRPSVIAETQGVLRRVGKADYRLAALGRRAGGICGWRIRGPARPDRHRRRSRGGPT